MKAAIVGCGAVATGHLKALKKMRDVQLAALCDRNEKVAFDMSNRWGVGRYYTDFSEMLDKEHVSMVSILTPPEIHADLAIEAIRRGVNVLVEKPFTMTSDDANLILNSLEGNDVKLTVNHNWLFSKAMMKASSLLKIGAIGQILGSEIRILHTRDDPMASNERHWCHKLPGGRFGEMISHPVYLLQSILGNDLRVDRIYQEKRGGYSWMRGDELHIFMRKERAFGNIYVSFNAPRLAVELEIYGTERILRVDLLSQIVISLGCRIEGKIGVARDVVGFSSKLLSSTVSNAATYLLRESGEYPLQTVYSDFVGSIDEDRDPMVTPNMAYNTVRVAEEICSML